VADRYSADGQRIVEISSTAGGCLLSLRVVDGKLRLFVYRADATVDVIAGYDPSRA